MEEKKNSKTNLKIKVSDKDLYHNSLSLVYLLEGDANPEYTPELFYDVFLSKEDAQIQKKKHPDVFHDFLAGCFIDCPSCVERTEIQTEEMKVKWIQKEWICGFDIYLDVNEENESEDQPVFKQVGGNQNGFFIRERKSKLENENMDLDSEFLDRSDDMMFGHLSYKSYRCP